MLIWFQVNFKQTTNCKPRNSSVWFLSDSEERQEGHQQNKTILIQDKTNLWAPLFELGKNLLGEGAGWDLPSASVSQLH